MTPPARSIAARISAGNRAARALEMDGRARAVPAALRGEIVQPERIRRVVGDEELCTVWFDTAVTCGQPGIAGS